MTYPRDYKDVRYHSRFPRTQREAGWHDRSSWQDDDPRVPFVTIVACAAVGAVALWAFLILVLG